MPVIGGRAHTLEEIRQVGEKGYPFAEINLNHPEEVQNQLDQLLELKKEFGLDYLAHFPNEGNPSDLDNLEKNFIPRLKQLMSFAPTLGISKITMHFWMDKRWASEELITRKINMLKTLVEHASRYDLMICLENLTARQESFSMYFREIPNLKMTMDIGHGQLLSKENTSFGFMEHLFDKIEHVHVHDNLGGTSVHDDLHLALGEGIIDYPRILTMLNHKKYNSTITMEVKPADMARTKTVIEQYIR